MNSHPKTKDSQETTPTSQEHLEEMTEETAKTMDSARRDVERAKETLHDQILSDPPTTVLDSEESEEDAARGA